METEPAKLSAIRSAWLGFVKVMGELLKSTKNRRHSDQFLELRDKVLELVRSEKFLMQLENAWSPTGTDNTKNPDREEILALLLLEIRSFIRGVEIASVAKKSERPKRWRDFFLDKGAVVIGSVKDVSLNLPWYVKDGLTVFKEVCDLFKRGT
jgi:hypothetical protein